jgi:hypothetical protein
MMPRAFVHHLCADDFRGNTLLPLNVLRSTYPDLLKGVNLALLLTNQ